MYGHSKILVLFRASAWSLMLIALCASMTFAARLKDIANFGGVRSNDLVGYGLVVGLSGTGDKGGSQFTIQSMANMLESMGVKVDRAALKPKNVAAVMVTAKMPVSAQPGARLDATVSSVGDAASLLGGVLLLTPLKGVDGNVYALTQGPLAVGGFSASGDASSTSKNIVTVGRIPGGAVIERGVPFNFNDQQEVTINLSTADFSTTKHVADAINRSMGGAFAQARDISTVTLTVPPQHQGNIVDLMASLENLEVSPDSRAKVVVDEKTGTLVLGSNVTLSKVAVSHGNLNIVVTENPQVSQPNAFSQGQTVVTPQTQMAVKEDKQRLILMEGASIQELVDGLNAIGATPRDLISILRTMKSAGALHADLEIL
ncbi:flagellar basal body P-ring protein FlgI [Desulfovibrionales bacterium]